MKPISKQTYQTNKRIIKYLKKHNLPTDTKLQKQIDRYTKENIHLLSFQRENNKFNRLRNNIKKMNTMMPLFQSKFKNVINPFDKYNVSGFKFNGKESIEQVKLANEGIVNVFKENNLKPNSKYNAVDMLLNLTFEGNNFFDLLLSGQRNEIRDDEAEHGGVEKYLSPLRWKYTLQRLMLLTNENPNIFKGAHYDILNRILKRMKPKLTTEQFEDLRSFSYESSDEYKQMSLVNDREDYGYDI